MFELLRSSIKRSDAWTQTKWCAALAKQNPAYVTETTGTEKSIESVKIAVYYIVRKTVCLKLGKHCGGIMDNLGSMYSDDGSVYGSLLWMFKTHALIMAFTFFK